MAFKINFNKNKIENFIIILFLYQFGDVANF